MRALPIEALQCQSVYLIKITAQMSAASRRLHGFTCYDESQQQTFSKALSASITCSRTSLAPMGPPEAWLGLSSSVAFSGRVSHWLLVRLAPYKLPDLSNA